MAYLSRVLETSLRRACRTFPAVVLTGPRQSGKTTMLRRSLASTHAYASLEDPDARARAMADPNAFLDQFKSPVVLDEIQYVPELLSYIKSRIDAKRRPGRWILTGSQNFTLMNKVSQSLAGRAAVLSLLPFSVSERANRARGAVEMTQWLRLLRKPKDRLRLIPPKLDALLLRGFYPELAVSRKADRQLWFGSYLSTYLERDVRNLAAVGDLNQFARFVRLCAARTAQILNLSEMARDIGVSVPTARRWLSVLETGYQVYLLYPYYRNLGKRLVKSPKLYWTDPAFAAYLMGYHDIRSLMNSPAIGPLFETLVVMDVLKRFLHHGQTPSMYYLRTRDDLEVDLVIEIGGELHLIEIKSSATITPKHAASIKRLRGKKRLPIASASVLSQAGGVFPVSHGILSHHALSVLCG